MSRAHAWKEPIGRLGLVGQGVVATIIGLLAVGRSVDDVLKDYPYIDRLDVQAALAYAAWRSEEVELPLKTE